MSIKTCSRLFASAPTAIISTISSGNWPLALSGSVKDLPEAMFSDAAAIASLSTRLPLASLAIRRERRMGTPLCRSVPRIRQKRAMARPCKIGPAPYTDNRARSNRNRPFSVLKYRTAAKAATARAGRLEATSGVVSEAADLLRSGGAELSAVAEMFTEAVDGYRESNERWLAALGHLESTLDSNGDGSAGAIVGEYLDQTREVFGDAMRFQRELFTELRAMRRGPS